MNRSVCFSAHCESDPLAAASEESHVGRSTSDEELRSALCMWVRANIVLVMVVAVVCTAFIRGKRECVTIRQNVDFLSQTGTVICDITHFISYLYFSTQFLTTRFFFLVHLHISAFLFACK